MPKNEVVGESTNIQPLKYYDAMKLKKKEDFSKKSLEIPALDDNDK